MRITVTLSREDSGKPVFSITRALEREAFSVTFPAMKIGWSSARGEERMEGFTFSPGVTYEKKKGKKS